MASAHGYVWQTADVSIPSQWHIYGICLCNLIWGFGFLADTWRNGWAKSHFPQAVLFWAAASPAGCFLQCFARLDYFPTTLWAAGSIGASSAERLRVLIAAFAMQLEPDATILMAYVPGASTREVPALYLWLVDLPLFFTLVPSDPGIAHAAHLGGMAVFGVAYVRVGFEPRREILVGVGTRLRRKLRREQMIRAATISPAKLRRRPKLLETQDLPSEEFISKEVDPILDKISAHGIQSLTDRERQVLQAARAKMAWADNHTRNATCGVSTFKLSLRHSTASTPSLARRFNLQPL